jgi:hypothetical protein
MKRGMIGPKNSLGRFNIITVCRKGKLERVESIEVKYLIQIRW